MLDELGLWKGGCSPPYVLAQGASADPEVPPAVAPIAERLGVAIVADDIAVDGVLLPHAYPPTALVNSRHPKSRQAFSAAHELAHWLFMSDYWANGLRDETTLAFTDEERRSDAVGAALLMPLPWLTTRWRASRTGKSVTLNQLGLLAGEASVSLSACLLRLHHSFASRAVLLNAKAVDGRWLVIADTGLPRELQGKVELAQATQAGLDTMGVGMHSDVGVCVKVGDKSFACCTDIRVTQRGGAILLLREGLPQPPSREPLAFADAVW